MSKSIVNIKGSERQKQHTCTSDSCSPTESPLVAVMSHPTGNAVGLIKILVQKEVSSVSKEFIRYPTPEKNKNCCKRHIVSALDMQHIILVTV